MNPIKQITKICFFLMLSIISGNNNLKARTIADTTGFHEITVFVFPSAAPLSWESPSTIYKTVKKSFSKIIFNRKLRFMGHMALCLNTSLLDEPLWIGIAAEKRKLMVEQVFKKKSGLGVFGIPFKSKLETREELEQTIGYYLRNNTTVTFLSYSINESSARQMLEFISFFKQGNDDKPAQGDNYGGIFWPLYEGEGAGCSALCLAIMEAGGIIPEERDEWKVQIKVPLELVGGEYYEREKIPLKRIKKTKSWHDGSGEPNIDYAEFEIYDPALVFEWILNNMNSKSVFYRYYNDYKLIGLHYNCKNIYPDKQLFPLKKRTESSFF